MTGLAEDRYFFASVWAFGMITRLFRYIATARMVYQEIRVQRQFNRDFLLPYLGYLEKKFDGSFYPEQQQKIVQYYGLFITSFLCSSYKRLYGKTLTPEERKRLPCLAFLHLWGMTCLI